MQSRGMGNINRSPSEPWRNLDWVLLIPTYAIAGIGLLAIYSASAPKQLRTPGGDPYLYTHRQVIFLIAGTAAMAVVMTVDYGWIKERASALYMGTILSLVAVQLVGTGPPGSGANAWFDFGPILVQPSEIGRAHV